MPAVEYQTKRQLVSAYQFDGSPAEMYLIVGWILSRNGTAYPEAGSERNGTSDQLKLEVPEGLISVLTGDWVVQNASNVFRKFTDEEFKSLYELPETSNTVS